MRLSTIVLVLAAQLVTAVPKYVATQARLSSSTPWNQLITLLLSQKRQSFNFNGEKVQGVNIGGWLVLEP